MGDAATGPRAPAAGLSLHSNDLPATAPRDVIAIADDLSGAAETAAVLLGASRSARIELRSAARPIAHNAQPGPRLVVADLDNRHAPAARAEAAVREVLAAHPDARPFLKIDSLLRGNVPAALTAAGRVVLAPALPAGGRTVRDGVLHVREVPLHRSGAWSAESAAPPESIPAALAPLRCSVIPLEVVRSARLPAALRECLDGGRIPVCDGETDADLDAVVRAAGAEPLAGSGGLAAALGRALPDARRGAPEPPRAGHALLFVIGTAEPSAAEQVRVLTGSGIAHHPLPVGALLAGRDDSARVAAGLARGPVALTLDSRAVDPARSRELAARLAETARRAVESAGRPVDLVLTGGETARRVLDALGITALEPLAQIHHGAVRSRTPGGTAVVTRPGSFGAADSLLRIAEHLRVETEG